MKKYKLLKGDKASDSIKVNGIMLYRVIALKDFGEVRRGDIGGYLEDENNLSQKGNCWVSGEAKVFENAWVSGKANVFGESEVYGEAKVFENAKVFGKANVYGEAEVFGNAWVYGKAKVFENANVYGKAEVFGNAWVYGKAKVFENANVYGDAKVSGNANVFGEAKVFENADVYGDAKVPERVSCNNKIKITVSGKVGAGKTTVLAIIKDIFENNLDVKCGFYAADNKVRVENVINNLLVDWNNKEVAKEFFNRFRSDKFELELEEVVSE